MQAKQKFDAAMTHFCIEDGVFDTPRTRHEAE